MTFLTQRLLAALLIGGLSSAALAQDGETQRPDIAELQQMTPAERRAAIGDWRDFVQGLSEEERAELRAAMQEGAAQRMAYIDSLTEAEREALMAERDARREEIRSEAEALWETLSEEERETYRQQVAERIQDRRGMRGEGGFGRSGFGFGRGKE